MMSITPRVLRVKRDVQHLEGFITQPVQSSNCWPTKWTTENKVKPVYTKGCGEVTQPFNSQIKFVILLVVNHTILIMLVQRI